jgi:hypothetical protein
VTTVLTVIGIGSFVLYGVKSNNKN